MESSPTIELFTLNSTQKLEIISVSSSVKTYAIFIIKDYCFLTFFSERLQEDDESKIRDFLALQETGQRGKIDRMLI